MEKSDGGKDHRVNYLPSSWKQREKPGLDKHKGETFLVREALGGNVRRGNRTQM